jgi:hypothetical protein
MLLFKKNHKLKSFKKQEMCVRFYLLLKQNFYSKSKKNQKEKLFTSINNK